MNGELIVDLFAGGGGASEGIRLALGRSPDIAINHDADALAMHEVNHPETRHLRANLMKVNPMACVGDAPIGLLWASPDCTHHSKAKGGKPVKKHRRDLAWIVVRWARAKRPRVIMLENVEEFRQWGPLTPKLGPDGKPLLCVHGSPMLVPCRARKGQEFDRFVAAFVRMGYHVEWRERRCSKIGVPTTRKRLAVVMRRDGRPIVWPADTHDDPKSPAVLRHGLKPWRTAAECIDWSLPCPSIFLTREEARALGVKRPLAEATMARIAKGVFRYVINAAEPFIVPITHGRDGFRGAPVSDPLCTVTTAHRGEQALVFVTRFTQNGAGQSADEPLDTVMAGATKFGVVAPVLAGCGGRAAQSPPKSADEPFNSATTKAYQILVAPYLVPRYGERPGQEPRTHAPHEPLPTIVTTGNQGSLVAAFLAQHNYMEPGHDAREPVSTIVSKGCTQSLMAAHLLSLKGSDRRDGSVDAPAPAITAGGFHVAEVRAFLIKYYGSGVAAELAEPLDTVTTKPRFGLVTVAGALYQIVDIGMRMLTPRELFRAHGFRDDYVIDRGSDGRRFTKTVQVRMVGNSVPPLFASTLVAANVPELAVPPAEMLVAAAARAWVRA